jgi:hypothetical protein
MCHHVVTLLSGGSEQGADEDTPLPGRHTGRPVPSSLLSAVCCLLSAVCCLLSAVCCLLSAACCLLSAACWLLSVGWWLLSAACWLLCNTSHSLLFDSCLLSTHRTFLATPCAMLHSPLLPAPPAVYSPLRALCSVCGLCSTPCSLLKPANV